jgi:DNA processing protein
MEKRALRIDRHSAHWPSELEQIDGPPDELWVRGEASWLAKRPRIAIVGTRAPTAYGREQARRFGRELAAAGAVVVSGLARGVDEEAHLGALDVGGGTIAVLGSGVDRPWPSGELCERVLREGLLLSEFSPGEAPRRHHFPLRNRVISGLAQGVVVIEAAFASGSLITARWAVDQNRSVFALPGRVDHPMAAGCHRLIREGAELVERPADVLLALGLASTGPQPEPAARSDPIERALLAALVGETLDAEELASRVAVPMFELLPALMELELAGRIARGPGGLYRLVGG